MDVAAREDLPGAGRGQLEQGPGGRRKNEDTCLGTFARKRQRECGLEPRHTFPGALLPQAPPPRPLNHLAEPWSQKPSHSSALRGPSLYFWTPGNLGVSCSPAGWSVFLHSLAWGVQCRRLHTLPCRLLLLVMLCFWLPPRQHHFPGDLGCHLPRRKGAPGARPPSGFLSRHLRRTASRPCPSEAQKLLPQLLTTHPFCAWQAFAPAGRSSDGTISERSRSCRLGESPPLPKPPAAKPLSTCLFA